MLNLGILRQSFTMSLQNIKSNKMRSFLTMLGIVIGVAAVIALITIVQSVADNVMGQFSQLGAGTISIIAGASPTKAGLTDKDIETLRNVDGVEAIAPTASMTTKAIVDGEEYNVSVEGKDTIYFYRNPDIITAGRALQGVDMSGDTNVCIVDQNFIKKTMLGKEVIGSEILIHGYHYTIVGIRENDTSLTSYFSDTSKMAGTIMVPYRNVLHMSGSWYISNADVYLKDGADSTQIESGLRATLKNLYNENDDYFSVINMESLMTMMDSVKAMLSTMLGGIASIALLVGGIGIMNMMLVSVTERTKEIGLRKAMGAEPSRIQMQFLIESVVLSMIGGLIGVGVGLGIAYVASILMDTVFAISGGAIALGVGFSAAVGIIFGWVPAKRASELNPIDALRAE